MESILTSIKKLLGPTEEYEAYDIDLIMHINSVLGILTDLGIGPSEGFAISNKEATWVDFLGDTKRLELVKSYVYMKVKLIFDPPPSSATIASYEKLIAEFEWRANQAAEAMQKQT